MKLYEFGALIKCGVVIAADSEEDARREIETYERAWFETGNFLAVADVELVDVREPKSSDLDDEAQVILGKKKEMENTSPEKTERVNDYGKK